MERSKLLIKGGGAVGFADLLTNKIEPPAKGCTSNDANAVEVQHIREGFKLHPRETGIQVVLEVKGPAHSEFVITALESSGFQLR